MGLEVAPVEGGTSQIVLVAEPGRVDHFLEFHIVIVGCGNEREARVHQGDSGAALKEVLLVKVDL